MTMDPPRISKPLKSEDLKVDIDPWFDDYINVD